MILPHMARNQAHPSEKKKKKAWKKREELVKKFAFCQAGVGSNYFWWRTQLFCLYGSVDAIPSIFLKQFSLIQTS